MSSGIFCCGAYGIITLNPGAVPVTVHYSCNVL